MCGSRKYPYPHHGGNWKFRRGGGVKDPGNSRGRGGCMIDLVLLVKNGNSGEGGGGLREIPSVVGVWIFSGTTQLVFCIMQWKPL